MLYIRFKETTVTTKHLAEGIDLSWGSSRSQSLTPYSITPSARSMRVRSS